MVLSEMMSLMISGILTFQGLELNYGFLFIVVICWDVGFPKSFNLCSYNSVTSQHRI